MFPRRFVSSISMEIEGKLLIKIVSFFDEEKLFYVCYDGAVKVKMVSRYITQTVLVLYVFMVLREAV